MLRTNWISRQKVSAWQPVYDALPLEEKQIICAEVDRLLREQRQSETSDIPVKLPVSDLGQSVLNLATEPESA
jgi:hypothetical protein